MTEMLHYRVPGVHCAHCEAAIKHEVGAVSGVERVDVDLVEKTVAVAGSGLDDASVRAAIDGAGFEIAS